MKPISSNKKSTLVKAVITSTIFGFGLMPLAANAANTCAAAPGLCQIDTTGSTSTISAPAVGNGDYFNFITNAAKTLTVNGNGTNPFTVGSSTGLASGASFDDPTSQGGEIVNFTTVNTTITGTVGATNAIKVQIAGPITVKFGGAVASGIGNTFVFNADGTAEFQNSATLAGLNNIVNSSGGVAGTLTLDGANTIGGSVGVASGNPLKAINVSGIGNTFSGAVNAQTITVQTGTFEAAVTAGTGGINVTAGGLATFDANVTSGAGNFNLADGGSALFNVPMSSLTLTGTVVPATTGTTLSFNGYSNGTGIVTGAVGSSGTSLGTLEVNSGGTSMNNNVTLQAGANYIETITLYQSGGATLNLQNDAGLLTTLNGIQGAGNVNIEVQAGPTGTYTITGDVGSITPISQLGIGAGVTATIGNISTTNDVSLQGGMGGNPETTLQISDGKSITGNVATQNNNKNNLSFLGASNITDEIGITTTGLLNTVSIHGAAGKTVTLNNLNAGIYADNILVNNGGTFEIVGTVQQVTPTSSFELSNASILQIDAGTAFTVNGPLTFDQGTTLFIDLSTTPANPIVNVTGAATVPPGVFLHVSNVPSQASTMILKGAGGTILNPMTLTGAGSSLLLSYKTQVEGNNLYLIADAISPVVFADQINTLGVAEDLTFISVNYPNAGGNLAEIETAILTYQDPVSLNYGLSTIAPTVDGGAIQTSFGAPSNVYRVIGSHLSERRLHSATTLASSDTSGYSAGDKAPCQAAWVKWFGEQGHQKNRDGIQGYNDTVWGFAVGSDALVRENLVLGTAFSWSNLQVRSALAKDRTRANSYQLALYGEYEFGDSPWYLDGMLSLAYNNYVNSHNILLNNLELSSRGRYYGWQPGAQAEVGYDYFTHGFHLIPLISLYYTHLQLSTYTETGAGNASQQVAGNNFDMLLGGLGLQVAYQYAWKKLVYEPEVHFKVFYDFVNDRMQTTSQFVGVGPSFSTNGIKPPPSSFDAGLSLNVFSQAGLSFTFSYDYGFESDYSENAGFVRVRYEW